MTIVQYNILNPLYILYDLFHNTMEYLCSSQFAA
jgi:hypothetical protein